MLDTELYVDQTLVYGRLGAEGTGRLDTEVGVGQTLKVRVDKALAQGRLDAGVKEVRCWRKVG
jgi:hypothetical protein